MRPHMWRFITRPYQVKNSQLLLIDKCNHLVGYDKLFCNYNSIILMKEIDVKNKDCEKFSNELIQGECKFLVEISAISNLESNTKNMTLSLLDFCQNISSSAWKSECYFLLADELSYLSDFENYLDLMYIACNQSNRVNEYGCLDHVAINLPQEYIKEFCKFAKGDYKNKCYKGYGYKLGTNLTKNEFMNAYDKCAKLENELLSGCVDGLLWSISNTNAKKRKQFDYCKLIPIEFSSVCYTKYGSNFHTFKNYINSTINIKDYCSKVPINFTKYCFKGIARGFDESLRFDIQKGVDECAKFENKYRNECFSELLRQFDFDFNINSEDVIIKCNIFPLEFQEKCKSKIMSNNSK